MVNQKRFIKILLITIVIIVVVLFVIRMVYQNKKDITADWKVYKNEKYGLEIKHPPDWQIYASKNPYDYDDIINIYKTGKPPFTHHSNVTQVSIFPKGLATEGSA